MNELHSLIHSCLFLYYTLYYQWTDSMDFTMDKYNNNCINKTINYIYLYEPLKKLNSVVLCEIYNPNLISISVTNIWLFNR